MEPWAATTDRKSAK